MVYLALVLALVFLGSHTLDAQTPTPSENVTAPGMMPTIEVKDVGVINGKCIYGGLAMEPTTLNLMKEPCEAWTCDAENYTVTVQRCGDFKVPSHCDLESTLEPFPSCCPVLVCEGI
ncbi:complement inhibitor CirpT4-like [Haemaphysalis longicornis]